MHRDVSRNVAFEFNTRELYIQAREGGMNQKFDRSNQLKNPLRLEVPL